MDTTLTIPATPTGVTASYWLNRLQRTSRSITERRLVPFNIGLSEWTLLHNCESGVETPAALAACLEIDRGAVTRLLDQLEEKGLISRQPNLEDRRSVVVNLTESAKSMIPNARRAVISGIRETLHGLSEDEIEDLLKLLRKAGEALPKLNHATGECPVA